MGGYNVAAQVARLHAWGVNSLFQGVNNVVWGEAEEEYDQSSKEAKSISNLDKQDKQDKHVAHDVRTGVDAARHMSGAYDHSSGGSSSSTIPVSNILLDPVTFTRNSEIIKLAYKDVHNPRSFSVELKEKVNSQVHGRGSSISVLSTFDSKKKSGYKFHLSRVGTSEAMRWAFTVGTGRDDLSEIVGPLYTQGELIHLRGSYDAAMGVQQFFVNGIRQGVVKTDFAANASRELQLGFENF